MYGLKKLARKVACQSVVHLGLLAPARGVDLSFRPRKAGDVQFDPVCLTSCKGLQVTLLH